MSCKNVNSAYVKGTEDYKMSMASSRTSSVNSSLKCKRTIMLYDDLTELIMSLKFPGSLQNLLCIK